VCDTAPTARGTCATRRRRCINGVHDAPTMRQRCVNGVHDAPTMRQRCVNGVHDAPTMRRRCVNDASTACTMRRRCVDDASTMRMRAPSRRHCDNVRRSRRTLKKAPIRIDAIAQCVIV
jgi:hypothetical protein